MFIPKTNNINSDSKLCTNHVTGLLIIYASSIYVVSTMMYTLWSSL